MTAADPPDGQDRGARGAGTRGADDRAGVRTQLWLAAAFLGGVVLHLADLPPWITVAVLAGTAWSVAAAAGRLRLPGRQLKVFLVVALTVAVLAAFHTLNGLAAGTALLALMGAAKLLETTRRRDRFIVIAVSFYLLLAACLGSQALTRTPLYLLEAWVCVTALIVSAHPQVAAQTRLVAALAARCLLLAMPLAVLLFLFFPRVAGSFWSLGNPGAAATGLSDTMSPGSISELGTRADPVFRVWFDGPVPPPQERYWRGPVLHDFDGYTWSRQHGSFFRAEQLQYLGPAYRYRLRLEPGAGPWWLALDTIRSVDARGTTITPDRQLVSARPARDAVTYTAVSYTHTRSTDTLSKLARNLDTALPPGRNPRSRRLGQQLRAAAPDVPAFVHAVLERFRTGGFEYTLTPPLTDLDSVDDFLFNTRQGFCGHFASAFVTLMRAGGVPARVVTGYQGGEWNSFGGYFLVRRYDAHAWAEVWEDGQGWVRVDPTAAVAPERLRRGVLDVLSDAGSAPARLEHQFGWLDSLHQSWDALNAWWSTSFVGYNFGSQLSLLEWLGFSAQGWEQLGELLTAGLLGWMLAVNWGFARAPRRGGPDRLARAYGRLCARLARAGFVRAPHQGPLDYARALERGPQPLSTAATALLLRYAQLRFGAGEPTANELREFERSVEQLRT